MSNTNGCCRLCFALMSIPYDLEDTGICDLCAQIEVQRLRRSNAGLRGALKRCRTALTAASRGTGGTER